MAHFEGSIWRHFARGAMLELFIGNYVPKVARSAHTQGFPQCCQTEIRPNRSEPARRHLPCCSPALWVECVSRP